MKQLVVKALLTDAVADDESDKACTEDSNCTDLGADWVCSRESICVHATLHPHPAYSSAYEYDYEEDTRELVNEDPTLPRGAESNWLSPDLQIITLPDLYTGRVSCGIGILLWTATALGFGLFWKKNLLYVKSKD
jgi:hypothetical protein